MGAGACSISGFELLVDAEVAGWCRRRASATCARLLRLEALLTDESSMRGDMSLADLPTGPVEGLSYLLKQWVDEAFPGGERDVVALNRLWRRLAKALCESRPAKLVAFEQELVELDHSQRSGYPPVHALEHRLQEIIDAGVRDLFIVVAVRQGLNELIALVLLC